MRSIDALAVVRGYPERLRARPVAWQGSSQGVKWSPRHRAWVIETVRPCWDDLPILPNLSVTEATGWEVVGRALLAREAEGCPNREQAGWTVPRSAARPGVGEVAK